MIMESEGQMMTGSKEKVFVSVRIRPLDDEEIMNKDVSDWECINQCTILYKNVAVLASEKSTPPSSYTFDRVFKDDCPSSEVYEQGAKDIALSVLNGVNSTIFVYGRKGSGKTYTLKGITEYAIADIYDYIQKHPERNFVLKLSAFEISFDSAMNPEKAKTVEISKVETLKDRNHASPILTSFLDKKRNGEALVNEISSLWQHIIRLTVESSANEPRGKGSICTLSASLDFVDLVIGSSVDECCQMNHSLPSSEAVSKESHGHILLRDSILMRIQQISRRENARVAMICTMSPARSRIEESRDTLLFAQCISKNSTNVPVNVLVTDKVVVRRLQKEVKRLEGELRNSQSATSTIIKKKDTQIEKLEKEIKSLILQRDIAQSQVKECLNMLEGDARTSMQLGPGDYPQIRVHASPDSEIQDLEAFMLTRSSSRDHFAKVLYTSGITAGPRALISSPHSSDIEYAYSSGEEIEMQSEQTDVERHFLEPEKVPRLHVETLVNGNLPDMASTFSPSVKDSGSTKSGLTGDADVKESVMSSNTIMSNENKYSSIQYLDIASLEIQSSMHQLKMDEYFDGELLKLRRCKSCKESVSKEIASLKSEKEADSDQRGIDASDKGPSEAISLRNDHHSHREIALDSKIDTPNAKVLDASLKGTENATWNAKDSCSNKEELRGLTSWPVEFKRLQREIIQLWHAFNVSLAHRTYFFLLFRGDPADAIYMELEIRRIKFLEDKFSRGEKATANLSASALSQERRMLSHRMSKKLSEIEREALFVEWGIDLNTKMRRLKLARQLWSKPDSIDHVTRSAYLVAKLFDFIEPGHVPSEDIYNLKLAPKSHNMGICSFKSSLMSIL